MVKTPGINRSKNNSLKCKQKAPRACERYERLEVKKRAQILKAVTQNGNRKRLQDLPADQITRVESSVGVNFYLRNKFKPTDEKRLILIDGSNVAYAYSNHTYFSPEGIDLAVRYFNTKGHETKVVIPDFRLRESSTENIMKRLKDTNQLIMTPTKNLPGNRSSSYDDRITLRLAIEFDGAIVTNDNYRDLINESAEFRTVIESRVIGYVFCKDMFMVPVDPYGRNGPSLDDILNRRN